MTNVKTFKLSEETVEMIREDIRASKIAPDDCTALEQIAFFVLGPQVNDQIFLGVDGSTEDFNRKDWPCPDMQSLHSVAMQITNGANENCCWHRIYVNGATIWKKFNW